MSGCGDCTLCSGPFVYCDAATVEKLRSIPGAEEQPT